MNKILEAAVVIQRDFNLSFNIEKCEFEGVLQVDDDDFYRVNINCSDFPNSFPKVRELGERIPVDIDRHVYSSGNCCLTTRAKESLLLKTEIKTIYSFIKNIVIPFFQNNSYYEINKQYINGEYKHGIPGIMEAYHEIVNITDSKLLVDVLLDIVVGTRFNGSDPCLCNSGKQFRFCHLSNINNLNLIDKRIIRDDLNIWFSYIKNI